MTQSYDYIEASDEAYKMTSLIVEQVKARWLKDQNEWFKTPIHDKESFVCWFAEKSKYLFPTEHVAYIYLAHSPHADAYTSSYFEGMFSTPRLQATAALVYDLWADFDIRRQYKKPEKWDEP